MSIYLNCKPIYEDLNQRTYIDYFQRLSLLARSIFKWENLPNGINEKWIEKYLFEEGKCMFYKDSTNGLIITRCICEGLNHYDEPINLIPVSHGLLDADAKRNHEEAILIQNNDECIPTMPTIQLYALRLAEITRTSDVNVGGQKTPKLIVGSDKQMKTMKALFEKWQSNAPVIFGDKSLDRENIMVLDTIAPVVFDKLRVEKHAIWNECMTYLGINNANQEKKERLVESEVDANDEQVEQNIHIMLKAREDACERINELFGTNIQVSIRNDVNNSEASEDGSEGVE